MRRFPDSHGSSCRLVCSLRWVRAGRRPGAGYSGVKIAQVSFIDRALNVIQLSDGMELRAPDQRMLADLTIGEWVKVDYASDGARVMINSVRPPDLTRFPGSPPRERHRRLIHHRVFGGSGRRSAAPGSPGSMDDMLMPPTTPGRTVGVLLVDDDTELGELVREYLAREGFSLEVEADGTRATERALSGDYRLVVLDVMLPGVSGFDILRHLRATADVSHAERRDVVGPALLLRRTRDGQQEHGHHGRHRGHRASRARSLPLHILERAEHA